MREGSLFFLLGIVLFMQLPELPGRYLFILLPFLYFLLSKNFVLRIFSWGLAGFLWAFFWANNLLSQQLANQIEGEALEITGQVVSLPVVRGYATRFQLQAHKLIDEEGHSWPLPGKVRLSWYRSEQEIRPGQLWRLRVKLKRPYGFMNPGGFDYEAWLFQKRIRATGYVLKDDINFLVTEPQGEYLNRLRYYLRSQLNGILDEAPNAALLLTLIIGDRSGLESEHWRVLSATGTNHLMAISGLHIGFIAFLGFWVARYLWPLAGHTSSLIATPYVSMLSAMMCAVFYAGLAGFAIPTQRALCVLCVFLGLRFFHRQTSISYTICAALLIVLLIDPFAVLSPGFWLSFAAFIVIIYGFSYRINARGLWWRWGRIQFLVAIGLLPLLALWFQQVPILSMLANIIAVPWVSIFTVPLALLGAVLLTVSQSLGGFVLHIALKSVDSIWYFLSLLAELDFALLSLPHASSVALVLAFIGVALLLMPYGLPGRHLGFVCLLPLFFPVTDKLASGELSFTVLDVGQGLAVVVHTRNHVLLYDTGAKYSKNFNAGSAVISPYLRFSGVTGLDKVVVSHGDNDHFGGFSSLVDVHPIKSISSSVPHRFEASSAVMCNSTQSWVWDGVNFDILHPEPANHFHGNNASCVLQITAGRHKLLLTGDIEREAEEVLVNNYGPELSSTVLVAPHHGSRTSSSEVFLDAVMPNFVIFPVGHRNRFGFPKQDIIARYKKRGVKQLQTSGSGAIEFRFTASGVSFSEYRHQNRRFWHTVADNS